MRGSSVTSASCNPIRCFTAAKPPPHLQPWKNDLKEMYGENCFEEDPGRLNARSKMRRGMKQEEENDKVEMWLQR